MSNAIDPKYNTNNVKVGMPHESLPALNHYQPRLLLLSPLNLSSIMFQIDIAQYKGKKATTRCHALAVAVLKQAFVLFLRYDRLS